MNMFYELRAHDDSKFDELFDKYYIFLKNFLNKEEIKFIKHNNVAINDITNF